GTIWCWPDVFPFQLVWRPEACAAAHVGAGMPKDFGECDRHRHERAFAAAFERRVGGKREFGYVELFFVQHALERLARPQDLDVEVNALGLHAPVDQRPRAVVVPTGERELEVGHRVTYELAASGRRKCISGERIKSGSVLIAIGRKAKRALPPRSHATPLSTDTRRAWVELVANTAADMRPMSAGGGHNTGEGEGGGRATRPREPPPRAP